jgi:phosphoribosylamine--glycine ligase
MAAGSGSLEGMTLEMDQRAASTVMLVAGGYPEDYEKGNAIEGLNNVQDSIVFHAGTKLEGEKIVTNGGRVLAITSYGENIHAALETSYANALRIHWKDKYYRSDLGRDLR